MSDDETIEEGIANGEDVKWLLDRGHERGKPTDPATMHAVNI